MRVPHLLLASMMVLGLVAVTSSANAATLDWTIDVLVDTGSGFVALMGVEQ